jgi:hypothetical protein
MYFLLLEETSEHRCSVVCTSVPRARGYLCLGLADVVRYPRSVGTCIDDRQVYICVGDSAMEKRLTGMARVE